MENKGDGEQFSVNVDKCKTAATVEKAESEINIEEHTQPFQPSLPQLVTTLLPQLNAHPNAMTSETSMQLVQTSAQSSCSINVGQHEEDVLSLKTLFERSSTPYTLPLSCANENCDLEQTISVSPVKEQKANSIESNEHKGHERNMINRILSEDENDVLHYTRSSLLLIRKDMNVIAERKQIPSCNTIELEARLRRLNLWRLIEEGVSIFHRSTNRLNRTSNGRSSNELMPAFFKRKTVPWRYEECSDQHSVKLNSHTPSNNSQVGLQTTSTIGFKDSAIMANRRVGSGRVLMHQNYNCSHSDEEINFHSNEQENVNDQKGKKNSDNSTTNSVVNFFDKMSVSSAGSVKTVNMIEDCQRSNEHERRTSSFNYDGNGNYVKKVVSGYLVVSKPKETEEKYNRRYKNDQNEEPEWFSCGPTSRLDTVELCGFDEDEEEKLKKAFEENISVENTKSEDTLNQKNPKSKKNKEDCGEPSIVEERNGEQTSKVFTNTHKEEKKNKINLPFHYDHFSEGNSHIPTFRHSSGDIHYRKSHSNCNQHSNNSKLLPVFPDKVLHEKNKSSISLKELFKQPACGPLPRHILETSMNTSKSFSANTEAKPDNINNNMPSVEQIEAKWRHKTYESRQNKPTDINNNTNLPNYESDNIKRFISQVNKNNDISPETVTPNLFNSDNLSNFIQKQQQLQQLQYLQNQYQQQALFANLQLKSIINRPECHMLLLGLARGEISKQGLLIQLANPRLPQRERESIAAVLSFNSVQQQQQQLEMYSTNFMVSQLQNLAIVQKSLQQQQQYNMSKNLGNNLNIPNANIFPRQISQAELQSHTNLIMQNALMKRKMEEQTNMWPLNTTQSSNVAKAAQAPIHPTVSQSLPTTLPCTLSSSFVQSQIGQSGVLPQQQQLHSSSQRHFNNRNYKRRSHPIENRTVNAINDNSSMQSNSLCNNRYHTGTQAQRRMPYTQNGAQASNLNFPTDIGYYQQIDHQPRNIVPHQTAVLTSGDEFH